MRGIMQTRKRRLRATRTRRHTTRFLPDNSLSLGLREKGILPKTLAHGAAVLLRPVEEGEGVVWAVAEVVPRLLTGTVPAMFDAPSQDARLLVPPSRLKPI